MELVKKSLLFLGLIAVSSCGDKVEKSVVDCFGQSILVDVDHKASESNASKIDFNITYTGKQTVDNAVRVDFGDGTVQDFTGRDASHTYTKAGTYTAIAKVGLNNGHCSFDIKETVTIK
ncbi:PKD domain-containing protein [Sphingobacterium siyangense]|uniref:PKD domain-containing protein n=1 Tax=Sphingobacterium siyangense TaxID=459529 RepID=UPI00201028FB|nr:PKD domain-containing protein [Sphingobacterium siyangense]UQA73898.1 PKD domain-containing protein [Sphingobacterium siyangense]